MFSLTKKKSLPPTSSSPNLQHLIESEARTRTLLNEVPDLYYIMDTTGVFLDGGRSCEQITGYKLEDILGKNMSLLLKKPSEALKATKMLAKTLLQGRLEPPEEIEITKKDGSSVILEVHSKLVEIAGKKVVVGSARDISQRKNNIDEINKLSLIVKFSSELVNLSTPDGKMVFINDAGSKFLGIPVDKISHYSILDVIPESHKTKVLQDVLPALSNTGNWEGDLPYQNIQTGKVTDFHATTFAIRDEHTNDILYFANVSLDISSLKATKETELLYHTLFNNINDVIFIHELDESEKVPGLFIEVNEAACQLYGYTKEEFLKMHPSDIDTPEGAKLVKPAIEKLLTYGHYVWEGSHFTKNHENIFVEISASVFVLKGKKTVLSVVRNISERKKFLEDIQNKNRDLERINDLTIGRELKMVDYKKRINELETLVKKLSG